MGNQADATAILKFYELRRDEQMREARQWCFSDFAPVKVFHSPTFASFAVKYFLTQRTQSFSQRKQSKFDADF